MAETTEVIIVREEKYTGKMTVKHRAMCYAFGTFLIWLGKRVRDVKTYEELQEIGNTAEGRAKELEEEYSEELKMLE